MELSPLPVLDVTLTGINPSFNLILMVEEGTVIQIEVNQDMTFIWVQWLVRVGPEWDLSVYVMVDKKKGLSLAPVSVMYASETWNCCSYFTIVMEANLRRKETDLSELPKMLARFLVKLWLKATRYSQTYSYMCQWDSSAVRVGFFVTWDQYHLNW